MLSLLLACGRALPGTDSDAGADPASMNPPLLEGDSDAFYADGAVQAVGLELSDEALAALQDDPRTWVEAVFVYEGERYGPVGVRIKGESSYRDLDQKPSFKVKFSEFDPAGRFLDMRRLVFNNMVSDPSMIRERVAYRFCREQGVVAPRANHVTVSVNGEPYGLYANVENTDEELLGRWFDDDGGAMWEIHDADFRPGLLDGFEHEEGDDDPAPIEALTADMATAEATTLAWNHVDREAWFRYLATMAYIGNIDGYPFSDPGDDAHIYREPTSGLFHFIPHGLDESFRDDAAVEYVMHGILATASLEDEACKLEWRAALSSVVEAAPADVLAQWVDTYAAESDATADADSRKEYDNAAVDEGRAAVHAFLAKRDAYLSEQMTW